MFFFSITQLTYVAEIRRNLLKFFSRGHLVHERVRLGASREEAIAGLILGLNLDKSVGRDLILTNVLGKVGEQGCVIKRFYSWSNKLISWSSKQKGTWWKHDLCQHWPEVTMNINNYGRYGHRFSQIVRNAIWCSTWRRANSDSTVERRRDLKKNLFNFLREKMHVYLT